MPTMIGDSIQTSKPGLTFAWHWESWTIAAGVEISSSGNHGVLSQYVSNTLVNHGKILSSAPGFNGVEFTGGKGQITNAADGIIDGYESGIHVTGSGTAISNAGMITGQLAGIRLGGGAENVSIENTGTISGLPGYGFGIMDVSSDGADIDNSGLIKSGIGTSTLGRTVIHNGAGGTIQGDVDVWTGAISLYNKGSLVGAIFSWSGQDVVVNSGSITGKVYLWDGNDSFNGMGGTSGAIFGGNGFDRLIGGKLADEIHGGLGNDSLAGGPGADHFVFDTALSASTNVDAVAGFQHLSDKIDLSHAVFTKAGALGTLAGQAFYQGSAAHDATDRIIYNPANGGVFYDADGSGSGAAIRFATLAPNLTLTNTDFAIIA